MRNALVVAALATALAVFLDFGAVDAIQRERALADHGVRTMAKVVSIENPDPGVYYPDSPSQLIYEYEVTGKLHRTLISCGTVCPLPGSDLEASPKIEIAYLPEDPTFSLPVEDIGRIPSLARLIHCKGCVATALANLAALTAWLVTYRRWRRTRTSPRHYTRFAAPGV